MHYSISLNRIYNYIIYILWLFLNNTQTTDETIHKDVEEVDERINDLANTLSQERTMNRVR